MNAQKQFWEWFLQHEEELFDLEADRERIFDQLAEQLRKVDPDLCFEFSPKDRQREFVVSAGGIKRAFPAVVSLVAAAPTLDRWRVTAFRPRRWPICPVEFAGKRVDPKDVQFTLLDNGKIPGIYLFVPGLREGDSNLQQIGFLMLDGALGEYDVECKLGLIKMFSPEAVTQWERHPLADLPTLFDKLVAQLAEKSPNPS